MEIYKGKLTENFEDNINLIEGILHPNDNFDIIRKPMKIADANIMMYYIDGL